MNIIMKTVQALEDSNMLLNGVTKTIKSKINERKRKGGFLSMLLAMLVASVLGNMLAGKEIVRSACGNKNEDVTIAKRQRRKIVRAA